MQDISHISIKGLEHTNFIDKTGGAKETSAENKAIAFQGETDRVYMKADKKIEILDEHKTQFEITRDGLDDVVVWNPWQDKAKGMADFGPADGWKHMVCVEAGSVGQWNTLEGGDTWEGGQIIKAL